MSTNACALSSLGRRQLLEWPIRTTTALFCQSLGFLPGFSYAAASAQETGSGLRNGVLVARNRAETVQRRAFLLTLSSSYIQPAAGIPSGRRGLTP